MMHALNDVGFFQNFPQLNYNQSHVWLLLYDLYCRNFKRRDTKSSLLVKSLFDKVELLETENALWEKRVKIAASIARLRIENGALSLSDLLPNHLSNERVSGIDDNLPVSCWINTRKVKISIATNRRDPSEICQQIETTFRLEITNEHNLLENQYKWDNYCPNMLIFPSMLRTVLARNLLIKQHKLIIQDRSFCLGPTVFCQILNELELTGNVIQTHINSPRCSAYLANILKKNDKINKLIIFNANNRRLEYEHYFKQLNINNVVVLADKLTDMALGSNDMEEVVAIYATPPNSYSAVKDPIDLVCGRGGDLTMLEILTESDDNKESKQRVCKILNDQKNTLMSSMSRPQVQFVLYETHSEFDLENNEMVHKTVDESNQIAKLHHATLQGKIVTNSNRLQEINNNEEKLEISATGSDEVEDTDSDEELLNIEVPETDIFDVVDLSSENFQNDGCFLALLQRRNVIRLDNKYMIQMAENRGLFGQTTSPTVRDRTTKNPRRKQEPIKSKKMKIKRQLKEDEILRIATPTHTFLRHTQPIHQIIDCPKYQMKRNEFVYKQWWSEVFYYLFKLKKSMEKNKILPTDTVNGDINPTVFINALLTSRMQIDEVAADNRKKNQLILPKLRLTRCAPKKKILKLPLNVTLIGDKCI